ncbi:Flp family type IVb pilin [Kangsaoukella pontilimi]|uniref:Flp family type IVb pilin n=1 Tax=Kangsaoukella pontilimi TaxID=2691042 RepID=UPI001D0BAE9D|nr:Flp family type IVb pilin [Kangsaoukella pontilimi]
MLNKFLNDESGATLVEYGVALLLAIIVGGTVMTGLGSATQSNMQDSCSSLAPAGTTGVSVTVADGTC